MPSLEKHTPGPWAVEPCQWDHGASLVIVAPNNGYIVAIVPYDEDIQGVDEPNFDTVVRHSQDIPNANLLAAASTLLKAAKLALLEFERISYQKKADPEVIACIKAAVAKAEKDTL